VAVHLAAATVPFELANVFVSEAVTDKNDSDPNTDPGPLLDSGSHPDSDHQTDFIVLIPILIFQER
jgi:hypothetical protein